ncbi:PAS domain S-box protein [bacterium]|nr:PAS domain S-box protein [bacterium]
MDKPQSESLEQLRKRAMDVFESKPDSLKDLSPDQVKNLLQELRDYQIELELQNEQLLDTTRILEETRNHFSRLYNQAPVGYAVLDSAGIVQRTNNTFTSMIGREPEHVTCKPFADLILDTDRSVFLTRYRAFFKDPGEKRMELWMHGREGVSFHARLEAVPSYIARDSKIENEEGLSLLITISDITEETRARERANHLTQVLTAVRIVNQLIARETEDLGHLLDDSLDVLTETRGYEIAWILLTDDENNVTEAHASGPDPLVECISDWVDKAAPACVIEAIRSSKDAVFSQPGEVDCGNCEISGFYANRAGLTAALRFGDQLYGAIGVSITDTTYQDEEERELIIELAGDIALAIDRFEQEADRQRAESELQQQKDFLATTLNSIGDAVLTVDTDANVTALNPVAEKLIGWTEENAVGRSLQDVFIIQNAQTGTPAENPAFRAMQEGLIVGLANHTKLIRKDGTEYQIADSAAPIITPDGVIVGAVLVFRDVTEEYKLREDLNISEEKFRLAFKTSPDAINLNRLEDGKYLEINESFTELMGYTWEDVKDKSSLELNIWDNPDDRTKLVTMLRNKGVVNNFEARFRDKSGNIHTALMSARVVTIGDEAVILSITRDITEHKELEHQIATDEARIRSIFQAAPAGIGVVHNRVFAEVNAQICEMVGYREEELLGKNSRIIYPSDADYEYVGRVKYDQIRKHNIGTVETRFQRKDGRIIDVLLSSSPLDPEDLSKGVTFTALDISERKRAEEALYRSEEQYRSLVESSEDLIFSVDQAGITRTAGGRRLSDMGIQPTDIVNKPMRETLGDLADRFRIHHEKVFASGNVQRIEHSYEMGGKIFVDSTTYYPIRNGNEEIVAVGGICRDVTEQRLAEEALRRSEARYRSLAENFPDGALFIIGRDWRYLSADGKALEEAGLTSEDIIGRHVRDVFPELWETLEFNIERAFSGEEVYYEVEFRGRLYSNQSVLVTGDTAEADQVMSISLDITERKQAEKALQESEKKYRSYVNHSPAAIFVTDSEGRYVDVNNAACELLGYTRDELIQLAIPDVATGRIGPDPYVHFNNLKQTSKIQHDGRLKRKDGSEVDVTLVAVAINDDHFMAYCVDITERKKAEKQLLEALLRQEAAVKAGKVGLWDWDLATDKVYYSPEWKAQIGYAVDEIGDDFEEWHKRVHPDDLEPNLQVVNDALKSRNSAYQLEFRFKHKDGSWRWIFVNASIMREDDNTPVRVMGAHVDITERKEAEELLRRSEEQNRSIVSALPDIYFEFDREGTFIDAHAPDPAQFAIPKDQFIGKNVREVLGDFFAELTRTNITRVLESRSIQIYKYTMEHDGETRYFEARMVPKGKSNALSIVRDVTQQTLAENALRESERMMAMVLDSTSEMFTFYDLDLTIQWANRAAGISAGTTADKLVGRKCYVNWHGRETPCDSCPVLMARDTGEAHERTISTPDGRVFHLRGYPVFGEDGKTVIGMSEFGVEVTEDIKRKEELHSLERQLVQSQKIESIGMLAGGVAHDLNNLLTPIMVNADFLHEDVQDEEILEYTEGIIEAANSARELVAQLLAFSRKQTLEVRPVQVNKLVNKFRLLLQRTLREDIQLNLDLSATEDTIFADVNQIEQIVMNLSINAQDAMPHGGVLSISTHVAEIRDEDANVELDLPEGRYICLQFADTGGGMSEEVRDRVFDPFFTTKEKGKGTGLGMSTVHGIVKQHGGDIQVSSEPGVGTTFFIYFKLVDRELDSQVLEPSLSLGSLKAAGTILVAEDDPLIRSILSKILKGAGFTVLVPDEPERTLELVKRQEGNIQLLISDVVMPGVNGKELYERLLSIQPDLQVLFISGYTDDVITERGVLSEGMNFLQKPFTRAQLLAKIQSILAENS